jgi:hypothetical protein
MILWPALTVFLLMAPGLVGFAPAQNSRDSVIPLTRAVKPAHSPTRATILAATLPGGGQAYNRKYWKIPIAYVGYAAGAYMFVNNQKNYKVSKNNYLAQTDTLDSTVNQSGKSAAELLSDIDSYRRFRDMSFLALLAWHGLTIIEANVDAHFFSWDVSEDLSLIVRPRALWANGLKPGIGLCFTFKNK